MNIPNPPTIPLIYHYNHATLEYTYASEAQLRPNGEPILDVLGATPLPPPINLPEKTVAIWKEDSWKVTEDHRQKKDEQDRVIEGTGTPYWLTNDVWSSQPRYMKDIGPLPDDSYISPPEKPLPTIKELSDSVVLERNKRIKETDYIVTHDYPMDNENKNLWMTYRQKLRDLPQMEGFPWNGGGVDDSSCPWPISPELKKNKRK